MAVVPSGNQFIWKSVFSGTAADHCSADFLIVVKAIRIFVGQSAQIAAGVETALE